MILKCLLIYHLIYSQGYLGPKACFKKIGNLYFFSSLLIYLCFLKCWQVIYFFYQHELAQNNLPSISSSQPFPQRILWNVFQKENYHHYCGPQRSRGERGQLQRNRKEHFSQGRHQYDLRQKHETGPKVESTGHSRPTKGMVAYGRRQDIDPGCMKLTIQPSRGI